MSFLFLFRSIISQVVWNYKDSTSKDLFDPTSLILSTSIQRYKLIRKKYAANNRNKSNFKNLFTSSRETYKERYDRFQSRVAGIARKELYKPTRKFRLESRPTDGIVQIDPARIPDRWIPDESPPPSCPLVFIRTRARNTHLPFIGSHLFPRPIQLLQPHSQA